MLPLPPYPSYIYAIKDRKEQKKAKLQQFRELVECHLSAKYPASYLALPSKAHPHIVRVATYNIHGWRAPENEQNNTKRTEDFANIMGVIKNMNADVLILQEAEFSLPETYAILQSLGYGHTVFVGESRIDGKYGNMIASKIPFVTRPLKKIFSCGGPNSKRSYAKVEIAFNAKEKNNLVLYATHLDYQDSKMRLLQVQELSNIIAVHESGKNVIIGADFNEHIGPAIKHLGSRGFINSFDLAGVARPLFTHWSAQPIDAFYIKRSDWNLWITGTYLVYSGKSDHLPIVMDIDPTR